MKRLDEGKVSFVDFLRSIKFSRENKPTQREEAQTHFADFSPQARTQKKSNKEERYLVRSAN
ncbi:MAG: hypothetical protein R3E64_09210 [Halioglobus sp.]